MATWQNWLLQAAIFAHSCLLKTMPILSLDETHWVKSTDTNKNRDADADTNTNRDAAADTNTNTYAATNTNTIPVESHAHVVLR